MAADDGAREALLGLSGACLVGVAPAGEVGVMDVDGVVGVDEDVVESGVADVAVVVGGALGEAVAVSVDVADTAVVVCVDGGGEVGVAVDA